MQTRPRSVLASEPDRCATVYLQNVARCGLLQAYPLVHHGGACRDAVAIREHTRFKISPEVGGIALWSRATNERETQ